MKTVKSPQTSPANELSPFPTAVVTKREATSDSFGSRSPVNAVTRKSETPAGTAHYGNSHTLLLAIQAPKERERRPRRLPTDRLPN